MKWIGSAVINSFVILKDQINIMEKVTVVPRLNPGIFEQRALKNHFK